MRWAYGRCYWKRWNDCQKRPMGFSGISRLLHTQQPQFAEVEDLPSRSLPGDLDFWKCMWFSTSSFSACFLLQPQYPGILEKLLKHAQKQSFFYWARYSWGTRRLLKLKNTCPIIPLSSSEKVSDLIFTGLHLSNLQNVIAHYCQQSSPFLFLRKQYIDIPLSNPIYVSCYVRESIKRFVLYGILIRNIKDRYMKTVFIIRIDS